MAMRLQLDAFHAFDENRAHGHHYSTPLTRTWLWFINSINTSHHIDPLRSIMEQNKNEKKQPNCSFQSKKVSFPPHISYHCENMKPAKPMFAKCKCRQFYLSGKYSISILTDGNIPFHNIDWCKCSISILTDVNVTSQYWLI